MFSRLYLIRNHRSLSDRIFTAGHTKSRLQEANLRILETEECERLGSYTNEKTKEKIVVNSDLELCAARVTRKMPPEKWIKVRTTGDDHGGGGSGGGETITYEKGKEDTISPSRTFFYGGKATRGRGVALYLH